MNLYGGEHIGYGSCYESYGGGGHIDYGSCYESYTGGYDRNIMRAALYTANLSENFGELASCW
ncbi:hypothetical protein RhiirA1_455783 [Rhizophagus irregularis]|uniref:Uncharacterized protein n=2 Tax=Rhizophagus irregularis TaxID=588596 RepID=A0A2N0S258_9GLOM|nr:hypothetical protein RhiirA1_455783 [Rhizophagus irregularis]